MTLCKKLREQTGLKQKELAIRIGVSPVAISHIENGNRTPSLKTARRIVNVFRELGIETDIDQVFPVDNSGKKAA